MHSNHGDIGDLQEGNKQQLSQTMPAREGYAQLMVRAEKTYKNDVSREKRDLA